MSNKIKYSLAFFTFIVFWFGFHRFTTGATPPNVVDSILMLSCAVVINVFSIYYVFIHKTRQSEKRRILNWRQFFAIALTVLLIAYRIYFILEDIRRGLKDKGIIIQSATIWIIGVLVSASIFVFLLRDKNLQAKSRPKTITKGNR